MRRIHNLTLGWHRDLPDLRDYTIESEKVSAVRAKSRLLKKTLRSSPKAVDLRAYCSPVEDQGSLGSCTAHAAIGMLEYFERRASGEYIDGSHLFLYKVTRKLLGFEDDSGAYLRDTMKAMVLFGVPPEQFWPYEAARFNDEPTAFCYSYAQAFQAIEYYRLDPPEKSSDQALDDIRSNLAAGLPCMFGFSVYSSMPGLGDGKGEIPFPAKAERLEGGHAVLAVGYDDKKKIGSSTGALLIRNSWSTSWGDKGYGWLPYDYIKYRLADDFWTMIKAEYVNSSLFQ
jgi:C1A family cysteine protease